MVAPIAIGFDESKDNLIPSNARPYIYNCTVLEGSVIEYEGGTACGILGSGRTVGCVNYANITAQHAAGITYSGWAKDCVNYGKIIGIYYAGGITSGSRCAYYCTNYGDIISDGLGGAIFGLPHERNDSCQENGVNANYGTVTAKHIIPVSYS